ncbi:MAG TPA: gliding motility-associated C-terminal domain-containing protein, partial [Bacteroidia bacterium]|nr:gliding motility-associated C-terminal domain-containing protein [Bacteroidia bacterium]
SGAPFVTTPSATFSSNAPIANPPATGVFSWTPSCNQLRLQPYLVTFKANDDGSPDPNPVMLSDFETFFIRVMAPPVKNLVGIPECSSMKLSWDAQQCVSASNPLIAYKIYRKIGCDTLKPGNCDMGMPSSWGYSLMNSVPYSSTTYTDNSGLVHGSLYSYRVVALYLDGSMSQVSSPICTKLVRDVPIITNVDVVSTGSGGTVSVKWVLPVADASNYDTTIAGNGGPYKLELQHSIGFIPPSSPAIAIFSNPYFANLTAVSYTDSPLNTQSTAHTYKLEFYDESNTSCPTQNASSVFLSCTPNDNQIKLSWQVNVPWKNSRYDVYKFNGTSWDSVATTAQLTFTDTALINGQQYCYKIKSIGAYPDTTLPSPLINWSQELCCSPIDLTPPCALILDIDTSCVLGRSILKWNNPNNSCSDDAEYYIIYYKPEEGKDLIVLDTILNINDTTYIPLLKGSIAGCYAVTAVDSTGNESAFSNLFCVDNCPSYQLPNVFTPNGDNSNDLFTPLHPYQYVKDVDIKIYDRWGVEVFRTDNPDILWDGKSSQTNMMCADGVYYYVCIVNDIRLAGIVPRVLKGNVHLLLK